MKLILRAIYKHLYAHFGPQHWWPAKTPLEVMVGAILTQSTSWSNVEKAIERLKAEKVLTGPRLRGLSLPRLASLIRSAGYYRVKAKRLKAFLNFFSAEYGLRVSAMAKQDAAILRDQLLAVYGIGPETADSILLYALHQPCFVVDAYTRRILARYGACAPDATYEQLQNLFMQNIAPEVQLYNEYHALLVRLGKEYCLKGRPRCRDCPLRGCRRKGVNKNR